MALYEVKERIKAFLIGLLLMPVGAFITRLTENMYVDVFGLIVILFGFYNLGFLSITNQTACKTAPNHSCNTYSK